MMVSDMPEYETEVMAVTGRNLTGKYRQKIIKEKCKIGARVLLIPAVPNSNLVGVFVNDHNVSHQIGFLDGNLSKIIIERSKNGYSYFATVKKVYHIQRYGRRRVYYVTLSVREADYLSEEKRFAKYRLWLFIVLYIISFILVLKLKVLA